jgi:hypothetical protein
VYLLNRENGKLVVRYIGAIDDNPNNPEKSKEQYLANAVEALLAGKPIAVSETKAVGCSIKWKQS